MHSRWLIPSLLLLAAALACGPAQALRPTAAFTQPAVSSAATSAATHKPGPSRTPARTPAATDTVAPSDTAADTDTPEVSDTPAGLSGDLATETPTALDLLSAASATPSPTPTRRPTARATAGPTFLQTVVAVKKQVENFGGQIDIAVGSGKLDCQQTVNSYEYVAARTTIPNVPAALAGAYGLYTQGVNLFITKSADMYTNCKNFLAHPSASGTIPSLQWTVARTSVNNADQLLRQAIIAAGGTP